MTKNRAVFLDRDGTIMEDCGYPSSPSQVELLPGVIDALLEFRRLGFSLFIVSNQSGVGRGYFTLDQMWAVHHRLISILKAASIDILDTRYCTDAPGQVNSLRKPSPGMILDLASVHGIDTKSSLMIGDKESDVEAGKEAGCTTIYLGASESLRGTAPTLIASDWFEVRSMLQQNRLTGSS